MVERKMAAAVRKVTLDLTGEASGHPAEAYLLEDGQGQSVMVWPGLGFNLISWKIAGKSAPFEVMHQDPHLFSEGKSTRSGNPILFPFPNRIDRGEYTWEGREYRLEKTGDSGKTAIHGFACRHGWRVIDSGAGPEGAWVTGLFDMPAEDPSGLGGWPASGQLRLTYRLGGSPGACVLRIEAEVSASGQRSLPFGLGYHPYFAIPLGTAARVRVPAKSYWELDQCLPTGRVLPVDERRDLNGWRDFATVKVDDVLTELPEGTPRRDASAGGEPLWLRGEIEYQSAAEGQSGNAGQGGILEIWCDRHFREVVVYTPPAGDSFCIEPYTCPTNAIKRPDGGASVGWKVLEPGRTWKAVNEWVYRTATAGSR